SASRRVAASHAAEQHAWVEVRAEEEAMERNARLPDGELRHARAPAQRGRKRTPQTTRSKESSGSYDTARAFSGPFKSAEGAAQSVIDMIVAGEFPSSRLLMKTKAARPSTIAISMSSRREARTDSLTSWSRSYGANILTAWA